MSFEFEILKQHIKELGFDIDIESYPKLKDAVKYFSEKNDINGLEHYMKQLQNCGKLHYYLLQEVLKYLNQLQYY